jgi:hypothetical protein
MSRGSSLPYRLRPNKAVDRELYLALLGRLSSALKLEDYRYIGLGGAFLEDFRLIHARLGITDLKSVEVEDDVHCRQKFNRPVEFIECIHNSLEDYLDSVELENPVIIWFDNTEPEGIARQIAYFAQATVNVPHDSVLRITLNANPSTLGSPDTKDTEKIRAWRLDKLKELFGNLCPTDLTPDDLTFKKYGKSILSILQLSVAEKSLSITDRKIVWALATHYADGQPMVTATLIVCTYKNRKIRDLVKSWEFYSTPQDPLLLDMPALSTLERLTMESCGDPQKLMGYELPKSEMGGDPFDSFRKFYRYFPHFSRVEL